MGASQTKENYYVADIYENKEGDYLYYTLEPGVCGYLPRNSPLVGKLEKERLFSITLKNSLIINVADTVPEIKKIKVDTIKSWPNSQWEIKAKDSIFNWDYNLYLANQDLFPDPLALSNKNIEITALKQRHNWEIKSWKYV